MRRIPPLSAPCAIVHLRYRSLRQHRLSRQTSFTYFAHILLYPFETPVRYPSHRTVLSLFFSMYVCVQYPLLYPFTNSTMQMTNKQLYAAAAYKSRDLTPGPGGIDWFWFFVGHALAGSTKHILLPQ